MSSTISRDSGLFISLDLFEPVRTLDFNSGQKFPSPSDFYQSGHGILIEEGFAKDFEFSRKPIDNPPSQVYTAYSLKSKQPFSVIRPNFIRGAETYATLEDIEYCISAQTGGRDGLLVNNGHPSTFLVEGKNGQDFFVQVSWLVSTEVGPCCCISHKIVRDDEEFEIGSRFIVPKYVRTTTI